MNLKYPIFATLLILCFSGTNSLRAESNPAPLRQDLLLSSGWKFIREDVAGADRPDFDDSAWQNVALPHTWNAQDGQDGGNDYYRGPAWYRLHLTIPADLQGKLLYVQFEGAATVTHVYADGENIGEHRGNFGAFTFALKNASPGKETIIAVQVSNAPDPNIAPLSGDFTIFGGLYRPVHLLAVNPLGISPFAEGVNCPGITWQNGPVSAQSATVDVSTILRNATDTTTSIAARFRIVDATGREVLNEATSEAVFGPQSQRKVSKTLHVARPHLWNGRIDPYLYKATAEVVVAGNVTDRVDQPIGLRTFRVDPAKGFFLNGYSYPLHGVNRHQDRLDKGWAISNADHEEDAHIIYDMGCTAVRLAHYQHSQKFYDLCDRLGLIAWAELPLVDTLGDASSQFMDNAKLQLTELIEQSANHPAICFWSLFNELRRTKDKAQDNYIGPITELNALAKKLDPTRLTAAASCVPQDVALNSIPDVIGFNSYQGWYTGEPENWPKFLDDLHTSYTGRCIAMTEYGAGASITQHELNPKKPKAGGPWHPEEWQNKVHQVAWRAMSERPWLWGTYVWNAFDFGVDKRNEGDHPGRNDKGLATYDRATRKDAWYLYEANLTTAPMVHINSSRFTPRAAGLTTVSVYSNCHEVELTLNGTVLGKKQPDTIHLATWENIALTPGTNHLIARARRDETEKTESVDIQTTGTP